jgi:hypothetical protein
LGERLACGELDSLETFDLAADTSAELFHLLHVLDGITLQRWSALLNEPSLSAALAPLRQPAPAQRPMTVETATA